ncbi:hypothetical protein GCK72_000240 [Caenorhabditis remanei]|uniref:Ubiquitin-like domain-containing protein n=1 Tax=Caenorhabditis remanei TaxID=31234 RepID=A0A6A5HKL8_CAERE|nr:hypothetical protein GCK72_000240 [Caenorhabditis remanei]KAF1768428.1 hypothetical protein GCK72_000240 [Caenorhabditis remanei]
MSEESALIKVFVKSPTQKYEVEIAPDATVSDLKDKVLVLVPTANKEQICIIYTGKILKDEETLSHNKIGDGHTVHLVIRNQNRPAATSSPAPAATTTAPSATPSATPSSTDAPPTTPPPNPFGLFGASGGAAPTPAEILANPNLLRNVTENPIVQSLMGNPEFMRTIISSNPTFQQMIERNPELGHIINDPNMMRQTMEMMRNPNMMNEMMRNHDQAIRNLQGLPGGEAALERLYTDVQEPLMNSAASSLGGNPFASLRSDQQQPRVDRAGQENNEALPNPWASNNSQSSNNSAPNNRSNDFSSMMDSPGMSSLMEQMMSNPSIQASMFSPEVIDSIRQNMSSNPALIDSIIGSIPSARDNPQISEGIRRSFPQMLNMMTDPSVLAAMRNPAVAEAFRKIQEGFNVLRREAPQLLNMFQAGGAASGLDSLFSGVGGAGGAAGAPGGGANIADLLNGLNMGGGVVSYD